MARRHEELLNRAKDIVQERNRTVGVAKLPRGRPESRGASRARYEAKRRAVRERNIKERVIEMRNRLKSMRAGLAKAQEIAGDEEAVARAESRLQKAIRQYERAGPESRDIITPELVYHRLVVDIARNPEKAPNYQKKLGELSKRLEDMAGLEDAGRMFGPDVAKHTVGMEAEARKMGIPKESVVRQITKLRSRLGRMREEGEITGGQFSRFQEVYRRGPMEGQTIMDFRAELSELHDNIVEKAAREKYEKKRDAERF